MGAIASALAFDRSGNLFIGDGASVRMVSPDGVITTVAGTGVVGSPATEDRPPTRKPVLGGWLSTAPGGSTYPIRGMARFAC
jgi:hypothetical protein